MNAPLPSVEFAAMRFSELSSNSVMQKPPTLPSMHGTSGSENTTCPSSRSKVSRTGLPIGSSYEIAAHCWLGGNSNGGYEAFAVISRARDTAIPDAAE